MFKTSLAPAVLALAILPLATARAGAIGPTVERGDDVMVRVSVGDLNLESATGARAALHRLIVAAREVCSPEPAITELVRWDRYKTCVKGKVDKAVAEIGAPGLVALNRHAAGPSSLAEARR